ncbi:MAG: hypothetical protein KZQ58_08555 [gamma proteobacterium symbiont of Bathyaustriella thionipta]|nr:hypothetical protein [gamma proteobacterium symbiont of Bathyaustriella thionipta]
MFHYLLAVLSVVFLLAGCATPGGADSERGWMKPIATRQQQQQLQFSYMYSEEKEMLKSAAWQCRQKGWGRQAKYTDDGICISIERRRAMECIATTSCDMCRMWMQCVDE